MMHERIDQNHAVTVAPSPIVPATISAAVPTLVLCSFARGRVAGSSCEYRSVRFSYKEMSQHVPLATLEVASAFINSVAQLDMVCSLCLDGAKTVYVASPRNSHQN
ncbi:hypothetical protein ISCGN_029604 [Ixodes scapularis]